MHYEIHRHGPRIIVMTSLFHNTIGNTPLLNPDKKLLDMPRHDATAQNTLCFIARAMNKIEDSAHLRART